MLAMNVIKYYEKLNEELAKLNDIMSFMKKNSPVKEKQVILTSLLKGTFSLSGANAVYTVKRDTSTSSETLLTNYMNKFRSFKSNFELCTFYGLVATVGASIEEIFKEFNYREENVVNFIAHLNNLSLLYQNVIMNDDSKDDIVIFFDNIGECVAEYEAVKNGIKSYVGAIASNYDIDDEHACNYLEIQLLGVEYTMSEFGGALKH